MAKGKIRTKWESEETNPDEKHLIQERDAELRTLQASFDLEDAHSRRKKTSIEPLVAASGINEGQLNQHAKDAQATSKAALATAEKEVGKPAIDINEMHRQDLELVKQNAELMGSPGNPHWQGYIWSSSYGGGWWDYNGESEEIPNITYNTGADRFDPRTQAWGEGWYDGDHSRLHGYLAFRFNPPSWGHLHISTYPWFHGYYSLYSNDEWYNSEYSRAELDSWVDVHQNFWRARNYQRRFTLAGQELHPTRYGRIDNQFGQSYFTNVGANDTVTIRVGARLYSEARAGGSHSVLNFQAGSGNYVYVPYIYWYLHQ